MHEASQINKKDKCQFHPFDRLEEWTGRDLFIKNFIWLVACWMSLLYPNFAFSRSWRWYLDTTLIIYYLFFSYLSFFFLNEKKLWLYIHWFSVPKVLQRLKNYFWRIRMWKEGGSVTRNSPYFLQSLQSNLASMITVQPLLLATGPMVVQVLQVLPFNWALEENIGFVMTLW